MPAYSTLDLRPSPPLSRTHGRLCGTRELTLCAIGDRVVPVPTVRR